MTPTGAYNYCGSALTLHFLRWVKLSDGAHLCHGATIGANRTMVDQRTTISRLFLTPRLPGPPQSR